MNKDIISGKWSQLKGKAQAKWGDLTNDDFDVAEGNAEYLAYACRNAMAGPRTARRRKCVSSRTR